MPRSNVLMCRPCGYCSVGRVIIQFGVVNTLASAVEQNVWPLVESARLRPVVHRVFPLAEAAAAHALMESSMHIGKIVLEIAR